MHETHPRDCQLCVCMRTAPGAVVTPIWDKAEALDISRYESTPYWDALRAFGKRMADDGRAGHTSEHVSRCCAISSLFHNSIHMSVCRSWRNHAACTTLGFRRGTQKRQSVTMSRTTYMTK